MTTIKLLSKHLLFIPILSNQDNYIKKYAWIFRSKNYVLVWLCFFKNLFFLFQNVKKCIYLHCMSLFMHCICKSCFKGRWLSKTLQHVISTDDFSSKDLNCILRSYQIKKIEKRRKRIYLLSIKYCHCFLPTSIQKREPIGYVTLVEWVIFSSVYICMN